MKAFNTLDKEEPIEIIEERENEGEGVKVLSEIPDMNEKSLKTDAPNKGNGGTELFEGVLAF